MIHVHGGGWTGGTKSSGRRFAEPMSLLFPAQIQDVKCAIRHLRACAQRYGLDPARIGAWGGSAGGQLVALLGTADASAGFDDVGKSQRESSAVQAVVAISAITDFTSPDELNDDYSRAFRTWPDPHLTRDDRSQPVDTRLAGGPSVLADRGGGQRPVLPAQSQRMHQLLLGAGR